MFRNSQFWIRLFLAGAALMLFGSRVRAQSAAVTFDALPRNNRADSVRQATATRREVIVNLREQIVTQRDSILRLNRALNDASLLARSAPTRVRIDTVRIVDLRVDTVRVAPVVAPSAPGAPAAAKAAAPTASPKPAAQTVSFTPPTVSGLLQVLVSGGDSALKSTYRIRRAEVKMVSDLGRRAQAILMIDVSKALALTTSGTQPSVTQSSRILQDAILSVPVGPVQLDAGQQRLPLGYEGSHSSSTLETVERALMESDRARGASFGDVRDLGVAAKGKWRWLDYRAGVYNGSGESMNETDKNVGKAVAGQLGIRLPFVKGLRLGTSAATSGRATGDKPARDRVGTDLVYARGIVLVQAEAMRGQDAAVTRNGLYTLAGVNVRKNLKVLARFDAWDPDIRKEGVAADVTERDFLAGVTWLPSATRLKVQFAVVRKTYSSAITPSVTLALTQVQASW